MFICFINVFITRTILCRGACMLICIMCMFPNVRLDIYYESNEIHCLLRHKKILQESLARICYVNLCLYGNSLCEIESPSC